VISPRAIEAFLERKPPPYINVRGKDPTWLHDIVRRATGQSLRFKTPWRGDDRDQRQLEAIAFALLQKRVLLHYAPRTGKTRIALDWLAHLRRVGWVTGKCLVVPHAPIGVDEWELQVPVHSDLRMACVRSGGNAAERFIDACESDVDIVAITWPTLQMIFGVKKPSRREKDKGTDRLKIYADRDAARIAAGYFESLIVDEIHKIMDPGSLRFAIISELGAATEWRLGMTGTPFGRDPFALWAQSFLVDGGDALGNNFYFFQHAFGKLKYNHFKKGNKYEQVFDQRKLPLLREKISHMALACRLEDIQDTNIMQGLVRLPMSPSQAEAYAELIGDLVRNVRDGDATATENIFVRLRQVSSGFRPFRLEDGSDEVATVEFADAVKYRWLSEFLSDLDPDLRVVIFHEFIPTGRRISRLLEEAKIKHRWLWGGTRDKREAYTAFRDGKVPVLVANHGAGGTSIDLSRADYMCVFESPVGVIAREQMLARPMARGDRPLVVDDLVCSSVEEKILGFHSEGRSLMELFRRPRELARVLGAKSR
jgi:hypothetical protein